MVKEMGRRAKVTLYQFMRRFDTEGRAMAYFENELWTEGRVCPRCGSNETTRVRHASMPYQCQKCDKRFSVKMGTLMECSKVSYRQWLMALFIMNTSLKGIASTKLASDIGVTQKTAWFLAHRIRAAQENDANNKLTNMLGATCDGGRTKREIWLMRLKKKGKKIQAKGPLIGDDATLFKDAATRVGAAEATYLAEALRGFEVVREDPYRYPKDKTKAKTHDIFWSLLWRGIYGVYHQVSMKHLQRYVFEFKGRTSVRKLDTMLQIAMNMNALCGKRLKYSQLIA